MLFAVIPAKPREGVSRNLAVSAKYEVPAFTGTTDLDNILFKSFNLFINMFQ